MVLKKQLFCIQWPALPTNASFVGNVGHVGQIYIYIYIYITVPWAHLGFRNKNAFKISNAPNGLFHLSGLGSLMIFSYYGFMEWTCKATASHNWGQEFESCMPWCLKSDRKCIGRVRQHSAKSRGFSPVSSHNQIRLGVLVKVGTLSRHKLQQLPAHVNSP